MRATANKIMEIGENIEMVCTNSQLCMTEVPTI